MASQVILYLVFTVLSGWEHLVLLSWGWGGQLSRDRRLSLLSSQLDVLLPSLSVCPQVTGNRTNHTEVYYQENIEKFSIVFI